MTDVDDIKARIDIVDVVSDYLTLQKAGRNFKARCPFHDEKTPSFVVNPDRQTWRCFGACAKGGDAFSFVMAKEKFEFGEALKLLAAKAGVELNKQTDRSRHDALYGVNEEATQFYQKTLESPVGEAARKYLQERGVDSAVVSSFRLGLSPPSGDKLKGHLASLGFDQAIGVESGLLRRADNGTVRDFFWGRLMFPIQDRQGRVVGLGGRALDGSEPKYINTPATPVFDKRSTLYGLHLAIAQVRETETVIVVEGYMDTIAAHQHRFTNVIASMGTALTEQQVSQLRSLANNFVLALDPDAAGQAATLRSLESSWRVLEHRPLGRREQLSLKIAALPQGKDPDTLIREDQGEWERLVRDAIPFMEFLIPAVVASHDVSTGQGKARAVETLLPAIGATGNPFDQERYFGQLADAIGVTNEQLQASTGGIFATSGRRRARPRASSPVGASPTTLAGHGEDFLEDYLLALLLRFPVLKEHADLAASEQFHRTENREVFTCWMSCTTMEDLQGTLEAALQGHLVYLMEVDPGPVELSSAEKAVKQCLRRLEQRRLREQQELLLASDEVSLPPPKELEDQIVTANSRLKELFSERG